MAALDYTLLVRHLPSAVRNSDQSFAANCPCCNRQEALWATSGVLHCDAGCSPEEILVALQQQQQQTARPVAASRNGNSASSTPPALPPLPLPSAQVVRLADVKTETVSWLWPGRVAFGKLTLLDGDPGLGKSTLSLDLAARLSTGAPMPGEATTAGATTAAAGPPRATLLLTAEDGLADTIRPRLQAAGADMARILALQDVSEAAGGGGEGGEPGRASLRPPLLPDDVPLLAELVCQHNVRLVIVDPLMAFLSGRVNSFRDQDVRRALAPLAAMAQETGAAVLILRHLNKATGGSAIYRGGGSIGISGAARSVLLVGKHPDDENRRVLAPVKNNLAALAPALAFHLRSDEEGASARVAWEGQSDVTADALLAAQACDAGEAGATSALEEAVAFLGDLLSEGAVESSAVKREARNNSIAEATLRRAKDQLGVAVHCVGSPSRGGHWEWCLPGTNAAAAAATEARTGDTA